MTDPQRVQRLHQRANEWRWKKQDEAKGIRSSQAVQNAPTPLSVPHRTDWLFIAGCVAVVLVFGAIIALTT